MHGLKGFHNFKHKTSIFIYFGKECPQMASHTYLEMQYYKPVRVFFFLLNPLVFSRRKKGE